MRSGSVSVMRKKKNDRFFYGFMLSMQMPAFVDRLGSPVFEPRNRTVLFVCFEEVFS